MNIYNNFLPKNKFNIIKKEIMSSYFSWFFNDGIINVPDNYLLTNGSFAEGTATFFDFLSNGMKARASNSFMNESGGSYIYMAFASNPFVTSTGIPTVAR